MRALIPLTGAIALAMSAWTIAGLAWVECRN